MKPDSAQAATWNALPALSALRWHAACGIVVCLAGATPALGTFVNHRRLSRQCACRS